MSDREQAADGGARPAAISPPRGQTFEGVQILRGIAASMVVFHHMCYALTEYRPGESLIASQRGVAELGASGVDIFFCISGLVIAYASRSLPAGVAAARTFAWRRILRVIPPYWVFTLGLIFLWGVGVGLRNLIVTPGLVIASLLLIPFPKRTQMGDLSYHPILDVGWTLTFEMYFYAICALVIAFAGGRRIWPAIVVALAVIAALTWGLLGAKSVAASVLASPLLLEFVAGVLLARFVAGRTAPALGAGLMGIGALGLLGSVFVAEPMAWRVLCWGIPGVMLVTGALLIPVSLERRWVRLLGFLGTASYTIYLAHPFFLLPFGTLLKRGVLTGVPGDLLLLLATVGGVVGSALTYFVVEGPLVQALKPRSRTAAMARETASA